MERKYSIDLLRIISAIAVVIIHVVSASLVHSSSSVALDLSLVLQIIHKLMNWSVPVFFMITGYCILAKKEYTYKQCFSHILKYILVLGTVGFAFAMLEEISIYKTINFSVVFNSVGNVISGKLWDHMWYIYAMIGIYLVLPIIHTFMKTSFRNRLILTSLLFSFSIVLPLVERWFEIGFELPIGGYLFYVCFGGMVAYGDFGKIAKYIIALLGLPATVCILIFNDQAFGYFSLPVCLMAVSIFVLISGINLHENKVMLEVSKCTFGIYLIHPFFINVAIKVLHIDLLSHLPYLKLSVFLIVILVLSFATTYILRKIPIIKKIF